MRITLNKLIKGVVYLMAAFVFCSCSKPKDLKYGLIHNVSVKSFSFSGVSLEASLPVENPNGYVINVQDADMDILADDKVVAHVKQLYPVILSGKSKGDYKIEALVTLANQGEILSLVNLLNGKSNLNLDGTVKVKSFVFTKNIKIHQTAIQNYLKPIMDQVKLF